MTNLQTEPRFRKLNFQSSLQWWTQNQWILVDFLFVTIGLSISVAKLYYESAMEINKRRLLNGWFELFLESLQTIKEIDKVWYWLV